MVSDGTYRWINEAARLLREADDVGELNGAWSESVDKLLHGVPCPQEDLGFGSPADRAASAIPIPRDVLQKWAAAIEPYMFSYDGEDERNNDGVLQTLDEIQALLKGTPPT
jgi:hypothetical protein